jgi:hypothetical protein
MQRATPPDHLPVMIYRPGQTAAAVGGCATCERFLGEWLAHGAHALCRRGPQRQVQAQPSRGCAFHLRAPGAD